MPAHLISCLTAYILPHEHPWAHLFIYMHAHTQLYKVDCALSCTCIAHEPIHVHIIWAGMLVPWHSVLPTHSCWTPSQQTGNWRSCTSLPWWWRRSTQSWVPSGRNCTLWRKQLQVGVLFLALAARFHLAAQPITSFIFTPLLHMWWKCHLYCRHVAGVREGTQSKHWAGRHQWTSTGNLRALWSWLKRRTT